MRWFRLSMFGGGCCRMVLASTFRYIFQVTDSPACVVMQSLRHAPRRRCLKAQLKKPCARRTTDRDPASVIPGKKKETDREVKNEKAQICNSPNSSRAKVL